MIKRNIIISIIILLMVIITGQGYVHKFSKDNLKDIVTAEQRQKMEVCFRSLIKETDLELLENYRDSDVENTGKDSECIAVLQPTGKISMTSTCSLCEAEVIQIIKGKELLKEGDTIQIMEGIQPVETGKEDCPYALYAVENFMQKDVQYLVCFDSYKQVIGTKNYEKYQLPFDHYFQISGGWFTCLNLNQTENLTTVEEQKTYSYHELETIEFFTTSRKTLKALYKTKKQIIQKIMKDEILFSGKLDKTIEIKK